MSNATLFAVAPQQLVTVRDLSHAAVQWPSRAARANLAAAADDSHSNLGWDTDSFSLVSRPLDADGLVQIGFGFRSLSLRWFENGSEIDSLALDQSTEDNARAWCDEHLSSAGLRTTEHAEMPYELASIDYGDFAGDKRREELETLGAWYAQAQSSLEGLVEKYGIKALSKPAVRCWPHHYDLATLFVLDEGAPETARSVGVGLSPGDGSYAEPYFYCTPWPTPARLPDTSGPMQWHTEGFTSLVCPASSMDESTDIDQLLFDAAKLAWSTLE